MAPRRYLSESGFAPISRAGYLGLQSATGGFALGYDRLYRPFFASPDRPCTDVWDFATVAAYPGKHPCEKPEAMMEHVIESSSCPGDLVLDCVAGSGAFPAVAVRMGRRALACDADPQWASATRRRCEMAKATGKSEVRRIEKPDVRQVPMFAEPAGPLFGAR